MTKLKVNYKRLANLAKQEVRKQQIQKIKNFLETIKIKLDNLISPGIVTVKVIK